MEQALLSLHQYTGYLFVYLFVAAVIALTIAIVRKDGTQ